MRVALLSDIHGNLIALQAVLDDMAHQGAFDQIVVAGDLVWAGPWPAEVVDRVRSLTDKVIQGNTDAFFCHADGDVPAGKQEDRFVTQLQWMQKQLGAKRAAYLAELPFSYRISPAPGHDLLVVHANPTDLERAITPKMSDRELDALLGEPGRADWEALAFGHLHIPFTRRWHSHLLLDVASAGLPMDGDPRAAYAILTWTGQGWQAEHRRVFYNAPVVARQMRAGDMPRGKHFAERLMGATYGSSGSGMIE